MIKLLSNLSDGFSITENHTFDTEMIKIGGFVIKLWLLVFQRCVWQTSWKYAN